MPPPAANSNFLSMSSKSAISNQQSDSEVLIRAENVSKIFCRDLKKSLLYGLKDSAKDLIGGSRKDNAANERQLRNAEFWANKGVSFELRRGECLGLIGHNGAGKTTLLKILTGLIKPDTGRVEMHGRVGALIALGSGFNPILTGRENIYINGSVLGFSKKQIDGKLDDIIDFAEIREFIDAPVQTYSSGMQVRLGFSVASSLNPDILIIDEVLAVGDLGFRVKCLNRIHELLETTAVIFVSHSMPFVSRICTHAILLKNGQVELQSDSVPKVIDRYHEEFDTGEYKSVGSGKAQVLGVEVIGDNRADVQRIEVEEDRNGQKKNIPFDGSLNIRFDLLMESSVDEFSIRLIVWNQDQRPVLHVTDSDYNDPIWKNQNCLMNLSIEISNLVLTTGMHAVSIVVIEQGTGKILTRLDNAVRFIVAHHMSTGADVFIRGEWEMTSAKSNYTTQ
jgi:lipopolysaccharide transport system ATP-binding protein